jgi:hypothetical protein
MSIAERIPASVDAPYERPLEIDARHLFSQRPELFSHFYTEFYEPYSKQDHGTLTDEILSFGEVSGSIVIARQDSRLSATDPSSFSIKQYDLGSLITHDWSVDDATVFSGSGDEFTRTLPLSSATHPDGTAELYLSSKGNEWASGGRQELIACARMLTTRVLYNLKKEAGADFDPREIPTNQNYRKVGSTVLFRVQ